LPWWAHAADAIGTFFLFAAVYITLFGGKVFYVAGQRVQARAPLKLFFEGLIVIAIRHAFRRTPTLWSRAGTVWRALVRTSTEGRDWFFARVPPAVRVALLFAITTRLVILLLGGVAVETLGYTPEGPNWRASYDEFKNLPARWDSGWYLGIAQNGYEWDPNLHGQQNIVFFPAYPMMSRALAHVIWQDMSPARMLWAGVFLSIVAFCGAVLYLLALARSLVGEEDAIYVVTLVATYPFAVFFSGFYTESLFLLAAVATFYHFNQGQLWRAAAFGLLTGLVRPNGWVVGAALGVIALPYFGRVFAAIGRVLPVMSRFPIAPALGSRRLFPIALAVAAPVIGFLSYCTYIYRLTGDPFEWTHVLVYWNRDFHGLSMLQDGLNDIAAYGLLSFVQLKPIDALNWLGLLFGIFSVWPVTRRLGLAFGLFVLMNILMPALSGGLVSIGRYSSVLFPSFIWLGAATPKPVRFVLVTLFALGQAMAAVWFFTWRAVY
jgi:hypothetical protein